MRVSLVAGRAELVPMKDVIKVNDAASDGKAVYVGDMGAQKIRRITPDGKMTEIPAPKNVNGIACWKGRLFAVSWTEHEIYECDPAGKAPPKPFGLAQHFKNLDGIEVTDDGYFIVSDFTGGRVCLVHSDRKTVETLVTIETPADIGLDRKRKRLYVPQLTKDRVQVFSIAR